MNVSQFETLIAAGVADRVVIFSNWPLSDERHGWEIWAYSDTPEGSSALEAVGNVISTQRREVRRWVSLDKLWSYLVKAGAASKCIVSIEQSALALSAPAP